MAPRNFPGFIPLTSRSRRMAAMSMVLAGGLVLGGCAAGAVDSGIPSTGSAVTVSDGVASSEPAVATTTAATIVDTSAAVESFLGTLSDHQREQVVYDFDDETKSTSWSNFPVTFVDRAGLDLTGLTDEQRAAAMEVLEALLGDDGYATVTGIMGGDQFLNENSSSTEDSLGQYYIAFFGEPSTTGEWAIQFGGHHVGINATVDGADASITFAPTHLGVQPAVYTDADGNEVQPIAVMYETAFGFYDSLTEEQRTRLYQGENVQNLVCAPGDTCDFPTGTGIAGSDLTDEQRQLLLDVIANWVGLADDETTSEQLAAIEATLDETYVNWSGATEYDMTRGDGIYFQISGPNVYIEFSSQQGSAGADVAGYTTAGWGHVHTIYRDPSNDYAGSVTQQEAAGTSGGPGGGAPAGGFIGTPPSGP
ncbi:DUF3500 domain-containing protein [Rhodococcus triatomae]